MKRMLALILALTACRVDTAALPQPVTLTAESTGYYCQMTLLDHPGPKGQIHLDGLPGTPLFFSQVRDAVAYLRMPEQSRKVLVTYVNDMGAAPSWEQPGANNWVPIGDVVFVMGSDMMGGMGAAELVPFKDPAKAEAFAKAHGGVVIALADIPDSAVLTPTAQDGVAATGDDADYAERLRKLTQQAGG